MREIETGNLPTKERQHVMKKQLLLVLEAVQMNGAVKGWWGYLSALNRDEWDVDMFLFDTTLHDGLQIPDGVNVLPEDIHCVIERVGLGVAVKYALRRGRIDLAIKRVVYSLLQRYFSSFKKWNLARPAKRQIKRYDVAIGSSQGISWEYVAQKVDARVKLVWVDTDVRSDFWAPYWNHFKKYIDEVSGVVCVSKALCDQVRQDNPQWSEKIFALNYVIDVDSIVRQSRENCPCPVQEGRYRLVTVGRYSPEQKGQHLIPAIAENLKKANVDFEWYVIAPGCTAYRESIDAELQRRGVKDCVFVTEGMGNPFPIVRSADISVQPSLFEGFGLTVSEALVLGTYVVASDIPPFREQIVSEDIGLLVKPIDVDSFTGAILTAVERIKSGLTCKNYQTPYSRANTYRQFKEILGAVEGEKV